jgi:hypothetical protein
MSPEERAQQIEGDVKLADAKRRADAEKESEMEKEMEDKKKADAEAGDKLDKLLTCMDALSKRMDAWDAKMDAEIEEKGDPRESSVDSDYPGNVGVVAGQPGKITADSRADSVEVRNELAAIQVLADRAASAWSKSAPHPWVGELPDAYCRRLASQHQQHSEKWGDGVNLRDLRGKTLRNAAEEIFADSIAKSCNPVVIGAMNLREVRRRDPESGHLIKEYYGDPMAWMSQFTGQKRTARFNFGGRRGGE